MESRQKTIDWLVNRLITRSRFETPLDDDALSARAVALSERYLVGVRPVSVRWVTNQTARWGSCSYYSGHIRVSHRLRAVPSWVLDSVLVHEVAHLTHPDHSPAFHRLAGAYTRHDEAGTFLAGYGLGLANAGDVETASGRGGRRPRAPQTGSSARILPSRRRLSLAPPSVSSICSVRRKKRCKG